jgi:hypothetical protein
MSPPMGASLSTGPDEVDKSLAANMDLMLEDMSEALPMPGLNAPTADAQKNPSSDIEIDMSVSFDDMLSAAGSGGGDRGTSLDDDTVIAATDRLKTMKGAAPEVIRMAGILSHESWGRVSVRELADIANLDLELVRRRVNELKAQGYVEVVEGA